MAHFDFEKAALAMDDPIQPAAGRLSVPDPPEPCHISPSSSRAYSDSSSPSRPFAGGLLDSGDDLNVPLTPGTHTTVGVRRGDASRWTETLQKQIQHAQRKARWLARPQWLTFLLRVIGYAILACVVYFFLIGWPLWHGAVYSFWFAYKDDLILTAGASIFIGVAFAFAILPLLLFFEEEPEVTEKWSAVNAAKAADTAVIIPCYKSASVIGGTLQRVLQNFPARNVFVVANGNSEQPLDNTADICASFGVRHVWVPIGSKISAQYVGVAAAHEFRYCLLIDDDVILPEVFPIVTDRIQLTEPGERHGNGKIKCVGYTLEATDEEGGVGSLCQQAQNLEYKVSGLRRLFFARFGSAMFPHGAVALWERQFLELCFEKHPGHRISEDWFFGIICRSMGGRIFFTSQAFVKTAVPRNLIRGGSDSRAGYGEMTVTSQRLWRWNFFLVARILDNLRYILFSWRLRQYELVTKLGVIFEIYATLLLIVFPFVFPVAVGVNPQFAIPLTIGVFLMYYCVINIINELHLRRRGERVARKVAMLYYPCYTLWLRLVNIASCFVAMFNYARYYSVRHPKVVDNEELLQYMLRTVGSPDGTRGVRGEDAV